MYKLNHVDLSLNQIAFGDSVQNRISDFAYSVSPMKSSVYYIYNLIMKFVESKKKKKKLHKCCATIEFVRKYML